MNTQRPLRAGHLGLSSHWLGEYPSSLVFTGLAFLLLAFSALQPQRISTLRTVGYDAISPILDTVSYPVHQINNVIKNVNDIRVLHEKNRQLKAENMQLKIWYRKAQHLQSENEHLKSLLNHTPDADLKYITARILSDTGGNFVKTILVNAGRRDGVKRDQAVLANGGVIGRIIETGKNSSRVLLITDVNARIPVLIENTREHAILMGQNDGLPILNYLPPDSYFEKGMRIITSGYGGVFPEGLPIGHVVMDRNGKPRVQILTDLRRLTHVRIADKG